MEAIDWELKKLEMELSPPPQHLKRSPQQKKHKKRKKKRRLIRKIKRMIKDIIKTFLMMLGLVIIMDAGSSRVYDMYLKSNSIFAPNAQEEGYSERIKQIEHMMQLSDDYYGVIGEGSKGRLATYDIEKDKLKFYNIGSYNSEDGMCLGFSIYEKLNYMDALGELNEDLPEEIQLSQTARQDLGLIQLDEMDEQRLYGSNRLKAGSRPNLDSEILYDIYTGVYKEEREDFSAKVENKTAKEILNVINYIQKVANRDIEKYPQIIVAPREYTDLRSARYFKHFKTKAKEQLEPEWITEKIDADEPVVIGIGNTKEGHALLVYAYDYVEEDILKLYISDSNLELMNEKSEDLEKLKNIKQYNQDVRENVYVLCAKDAETQRWEYIYNPKINNNYVYKGRYNSYIPGTNISIYSEQ